MKNDKTLLMLNLFIGVIILASLFLLQEKGEERKMSVSGSAEKKVAPDLGVLTFSIVTVDDNVTEAEERNSEINNRIMERFNATTTRYQIYREKPDELKWQNESTIQKYTVRNTITIRSTNLESLGETVSSVIDMGANEVQSVRYELSDELRETVQDSLMAEAVEDAREKAEELANQADVRIKGVSRIQPQSGGYYPMYESSDARDANFKPDSQDVTYSVNIEYLI
ncbi:MAG: SIMPL domain-containing protein [Candidatus Woesearchaeota archaeon]